jgi:hypothetical protein
MKDDLVKNEMRLAAIEYLLCQLWVNSMKFGGVTEQEFARDRPFIGLKLQHKVSVANASRMHFSMARNVGRFTKEESRSRLPRPQRRTSAQNCSEHGNEHCAC